MLKRDPIDQRRADMVKTLRSEIRLKHSLAADNEINEVIPKAVKEFNKAVLRGELPEVNRG